MPPIRGPGIRKVDGPGVEIPILSSFDFDHLLGCESLLVPGLSIY